jgi:hypothetical protein
MNLKQSEKVVHVFKEEKNLGPAGNRTPAIQTVAHRYTD